MKKNLRLMALMLSGLLLLSGCGGSQVPQGSEASSSAEESTDAGQDESKQYKDTIHISITQQPPSLDLHKNSSLISREIMDDAVYEKLVTLNGKAEPVPSLAESFELSEDAKTLTFVLRKDVKFHDGSVMTADDVVASMNRWIEGFSTVGKMLGDARFEKVDDTTVKITADTSLLLLPTMIAGSAQPASITTAAACQDEDDNGFLKQYIGTGPYKFDEWVQDQYIKLSKFTDYTGFGTEGEPMDGLYGYKEAKTENLEYDICPDPSTETAGLEAGQYDFAFNITADDYPRLEANDTLDTSSMVNGHVAFVFNHKQGIAANQYFRTAVNTAINCDEVLTAAYGSGYELGSCYMDAGQDAWLSDAGSENYNLHDPEKAKQILSDGGYNGEKFVILSATLNNMDKMAVALQSELQAIGINVELKTVDWATLTDYRKDPEQFDMYITSFASVPLPTLKLYYGADYPGWSDDAKLTELFNVMTEATTMDMAQKAWGELQGYSWEYLPIVCPGHYLANYAWSKKLKGVDFPATGPKFWNAYAEE